MSCRHLISIDDLTNDEILQVFNLADELADIHKRRTSQPILAGKILATLFYEPSTRTRLSFESAMHRLGGDVISAPDMQASSSAAKGETIADTAKVVSYYADVIVIRHPADGSARVAAENATVPIINAGDGSHEHPTQTLCDLYTLRKEKGDIKGLTVALCGDLRFGRTVHSLASALARFGADLLLIPAQGLDMPADLLRRLAFKHNQRLEKLQTPDLLVNGTQHVDAVYMTSTDQLSLQFPEELRLEVKLELKGKLPKFDVVYVTRQQKERIKREGLGSAYPRIDRELLKKPRWKDAILMHPLPRVDEIAKELDVDPRSKYFAQAENGVWVRMALLRLLLDESLARQAVWPASAPVATVYKPEGGELPCVNDNCISRVGGEGSPEFSVLTRERTYTSHVMILECRYCGSDLPISVIANRKKRKFCAYDPALEEFITAWSSEGSLVLFRCTEDAVAAGFTQYMTGPQIRVMGAEGVDEAIEKLARDIRAAIPDLGFVRLIGLRSRGDVLARRIATVLSRDTGVSVPVGTLDVLPYRDDVQDPGQPRDTFDFSIEDKIVILIDDVLYSGRTTRAAMKAILSDLGRGRPRDVKLAVLVDRGHREMPIKPTFVGKDLPSARIERVEVRLRDAPGADEVLKFRMLIDEEESKAEGAVSG